MPHHGPLIATIIAGVVLAFAFGALASPAAWDIVRVLRDRSQEVIARLD